MMLMMMRLSFWMVLACCYFGLVHCTLVFANSPVVLFKSRVCLLMVLFKFNVLMTSKQCLTNVYACSEDITEMKNLKKIRM